MYPHKLAFYVLNTQPQDHYKFILIESFCF